MSDQEKEGGRIQLPISRGTARKMDAMRRPGETDDDLIRRVTAFKETVQGPITASQLINGLSPLNRMDPGAGFRAEAMRREMIAPTSGPLEQALQAAAMNAPPLDAGPDAVARHWKNQLRAEQVFEPGIVRDTAVKVATVLEGLEPDTRKEVLRELHEGSLDITDARTPKLPRGDAFTKAVAAEIDQATPREITMAHEIGAMATAPALQKLGESCFYKCVDSWRKHETEWLLSRQGDKWPAEFENTVGGSPDLGIFLVQHDWAAAFAKAQDFDGGEYRLPYDESIFEFRISGKRVCCSFATSEGGTPKSAIIQVETSVGWCFPAMYFLEHGAWRAVKGTTRFDPVWHLIIAQVRAIAIALEAEVAESEIIRAPHKLNAKRERAGKLPLFDYHVVNLCRRKRYAPIEHGAGDEEGEHRQKRLHFVRGHYRHYSGHKTWIKWHLRGNPDLGFIQKEYAL